MSEPVSSDHPDSHVIGELKRCLLRLSYIGTGLSKELDALLTKLRNLLKEDVDLDPIKDCIDQISKVLLTLEEKQPTRKIDHLVEDINLIHQLLKTELPPPLRAKLREASHQVNSHDLDESIRTVVNSINQYLASIAKEASAGTANQPARSAGFLSRLFKSKPSLHPKQSTETSEQALTPISYVVPQEIKDSLKNLVDQLSLQNNYSELALNLFEQIERLATIKDLVQILELLSNAFIEISGHENRQFESFLKLLHLRIERVNQFISTTTNYSQRVKNDSGQLDSELKSSVSELCSSLEKSNSLIEVKASLYQKMDDMMAKVNRFCQAQADNHEQLNQNIAELQDQLKTTENEAEKLRKALVEQENRAKTDPLTGLPNRYAYNMRLNQEFSRFKRYHSPLSLVICDIDHFKKVNDTYGHDAGDLVLKEFASHIRKGVRESDFAARFGGEEFIILLPETDLINATKAMNKLRQSLKDLPIKCGEQTIKITASFGISLFGEGDTAKQVFTRADIALYRAKNRGRDQVCCQIDDSTE